MLLHLTGEEGPIISETEEEYYLEFARKLYDIKQEIEPYFKGHSKEEIFSKQETLAQEILQKSNDILEPLEFVFEDDEDGEPGTYSLRLNYSWNEEIIYFSDWNTMYFVLNEDDVYLGAYVEWGC